MSTELTQALKDAATSLETISRLAGKMAYLGDDGEKIPTYMEHHDQVRGYAASRATCAREAIAAHEALAAVPVEPVAGKMTAQRAKFFLLRFKHAEKLLGPNEQAGLDYAIAALEREQHEHPAPQPQKAGVALSDELNEALLWANKMGAVGHPSPEAAAMREMAAHVAAERVAVPAGIGTAANSIATMVIEWVDGGGAACASADWRPGLASLIARRLSRFALAATSGVAR